MSGFIYRQHRGYTSVLGTLTLQGYDRAFKTYMTDLIKKGFQEWLEGLDRSSFTHPYESEGLSEVVDENMIFITTRFGKIVVSCWGNVMNVTVTVGYDPDHPGGYFYEGAAQEFEESPIWKRMLEGMIEFWSAETSERAVLGTLCSYAEHDEEDDEPSIWFDTGDL